MPNQEQFTDIEQFIDWYISKRPATIYLVKNKARYAEVMDAIRTICGFATDGLNKDGTTFSMPHPDPLLGTSLILEITCDLLVFEDTQKFCAALSKADNFEVRTTNKGKVFIGIVFQDVYDLASPRK